MTRGAGRPNWSHTSHPMNPIIKSPFPWTFRLVGGGGGGAGVRTVRCISSRGCA